MALEARHHNQYFPQIILNNREFVKIDEAKLNNFVPMGCANPFATTMENPWLGMNHQFLGMNNMMIQPEINFLKMENENGLCNNLPNGPRKRPRDSMENQFDNLIIPPFTNNVPVQGFAPQSDFPNDGQHIWDVDYILSQMNKNIKLEFATLQEQDVKFVLANVTSKFVKRMKIKNDQLSRIAKLNMALQEREKSLYAEAQLWKDIANTAELTNMTLRKDFDTILGKVSKLNAPKTGVAAEEDAESCCGSTDSGKNNQEVSQGTKRNSGFIDRNRMCKKCGERESSVLVLPCRHLCLCGVCGGSVQANCPVCNSCMTTTVHVCLT